MIKLYDQFLGNRNSNPHATYGDIWQF